MRAGGKTKTWMQITQVPGRGMSSPSESRSMDPRSPIPSPRIDRPSFWRDLLRELPIHNLVSPVLQGSTQNKFSLVRLNVPRKMCGLRLTSKMSRAQKSRRPPSAGD